MVTLVFGAGGSIPFFSPTLSTDYLTNKVLDPDEWQRVYKHYVSLIDSNIVIPELEDIYDLIKQITEVRKNANFEEIAEILDKVCSWRFDHLPENTFLASIVAVLANDSLKQVSRISGCGWKIVPFLFRQIIAEAICDLQNNHKKDNYDQLIERQTQFFNDMCNRFQNMSIMSLNYDDCVINSAIPAGFDTCFNCGCSSLDVHNFLTSNKVVYFPHGHTRFVYVDTLGVLYFTDSKRANSKRWNSFNNSTMTDQQISILQGTFAYNFNNFITTGQTKDDALNNAPFCYYYQRFSQDVFASETIILIGYGFGDDHFNRTLHAFLQLGSKRRVVIVDYNEDHITRIHEHRENTNTITKIFDCFNCNWTFTDPDLLPENQEEINKINDIGYGFLFDQVLYYRKGYEKFLSEYDTVLKCLK